MRAPNHISSVFTVVETVFFLTEDTSSFFPFVVKARSVSKSWNEGGETKFCFHLIVIAGKLSAWYLCTFSFQS